MKKRGFIYGLAVCMLAEISFATNGIGSKKLGDLGVETHSILFWRFSLASLIFAAFLLLGRQSFRVSRRDAVTGVLCGLCFSGSALTLYTAFTMMATGLACTLLFVYPFMTMAIMAAFFRERTSFDTIVAACVAFGGTAIISAKGGGGANAVGVAYVMASALSYALYLVVFSARKPSMGAFRMSLFTTLVSSLAIAAHGYATGNGIMPIRSPAMLGYELFLAIVPTVVSVYFTVEALKYLGATLTGILGCMEPMGAVVIGILLLGETFTPLMALGSFMILSSVTYLGIKGHIAERRALARRGAG